MSPKITDLYSEKSAGSYRKHSLGLLTHTHKHALWPTWSWVLFLFIFNWWPARHTHENKEAPTLSSNSPSPQKKSFALTTAQTTWAPLLSGAAVNTAHCRAAAPAAHPAVPLPSRNAPNRGLLIPLCVPMCGSRPAQRAAGIKGAGGNLPLHRGSQRGKPGAPTVLWDNHSSGTALAKPNSSHRGVRMKSDFWSRKKKKSFWTACEIPQHNTKRNEFGFSKW